MLNVKKSDWEHEETSEISVTKQPDEQRKKEQAREQENRLNYGNKKRPKEQERARENGLIYRNEQAEFWLDWSNGEQTSYISY